MEINILVQFASDYEPSDYLECIHNLIAKFCEHTGSRLWLTGDTDEAARTIEYSREALVSAIQQCETRHRATIAWWNGRRSLDGCRFITMLSPSGAHRVNAISATLYGSMNTMLAFDFFVSCAVSTLNAISGRVVSGDVLRHWAYAEPKPKAPLGEISWLRGNHPLDVEGFEARQHGKGTLYRMQRDRAEQDTEARAMLIAGLRARLALE